MSNQSETEKRNETHQLNVEDLEGMIVSQTIASSTKFGGKKLIVETYVREGITAVTKFVVQTKRGKETFNYIEDAVKVFNIS